MTLDAAILAYRLDVDPRYWALSQDARDAADNGIGPESRPLFRAFATAVLHRWRPGTRIHDVDFAYFNDGSKVGFHKANRRLRTNGRRIILAEVGWWRFLERSYLMWVNDRLFQAIESDEGWKAYQDAYARLQAEGPERSADA